MRARPVVGVVACVLLGLAAGCSDGGDGGEPTPKPTASPSPTATPWASFDPPTQFEPNPSLSLGSQEFAEDVLLQGTNAFLATPTGIMAVDLTTQKVEKLMTPERPPTGADPEQASVFAKHHTPVLAEVAGRPVVVAPYPVTIPAQGTTQEAPGLDLLVVDAETRKPLTTVKLDFTETDVPGGTGISGARVVGAQGSLVVLSVNPGPSMVVDLATQKVLWKNESVEAYGLLGDTVMSATFRDETEVRGLALRDGTTRWTALPKSHGIDIAPIGPQRAVVIGIEYSSADPFYALVDGNGKLTGLDRNAPKEREDEVTCQYDGTSVAVCTFGHSTSQQIVVAYDSASGRELWKLPDAAARRTAPTVTAVWRGQVYGQANAGPVILDARTGKDKVVPHIAPVAVNGYAAIAKPATPKDPIQVYRVTG